MSIDVILKMLTEVGLPVTLVVVSVGTLGWMVKRQLTKLENRVDKLEKEVALCHLERLTLKSEKALLEKRLEESRHRVEILNGILIKESLHNGQVDSN